MLYLILTVATYDMKSTEKSEDKFGGFNYLLYLCIRKRKQYENYQNCKRLERTD